MIYLDKFIFASREDEESFIHGIRRTCYDTYYPFQLFPFKGLRELSFKDITLLYGGNGSGKSTVLNVIASKTGAERTSQFNKSNFWDDYLKLCTAEYQNRQYQENRIITSDDVFDQMLDIRTLNEGIDITREEKFQEYLDYKFRTFRLESIGQIDELRKARLAKSKTQSKYIRSETPDNIREYSNGESAYKYFQRHIDENGIYLLDEPENSLSCRLQLDLLHYIEEAVRFYNCQFIIATHSPFFLGMKNALIYDLDQEPVCSSDWTDLENVRIYYDFFKERKDEFES